MQHQIHAIADNFLKQIPFCNALGIAVDSVDLEQVVLSLEKQKDQVGNFVLDILHGGVIATILDTAGAVMSVAGAYHRLIDLSESECIQKIANTGTIDLRIDYLEPAFGNEFRANASLMRAGKRVSVTRMELYNEKKTLIAAGTGTYLVE